MRKLSTPTKVKTASSSTPMVGLKEMVTRQKVIKEKKVLIRSEIQSFKATIVNPRKIESLRVNVINAGRRVT